MSGDPQLGGGGWRPRWWLALVAIGTFALGLYCALHEINGVGERPATLAFCAALILPPAVVLVLERLRR